MKQLKTPTGRKIKPRQEVEWFARRMEQTLKKNDWKGGWEQCDLEWLLKRCGDELGELKRNLEKFKVRKTASPKELERLIDEATDVENFAMMIADNSRKILMTEIQ